MKKWQLPLVSGLLLALIYNGLAVIRCVDLNSLAPMPPYTNWSTAARNIQDAIDAAIDGDLVLVTNGVYGTGGRAVTGQMTNRVVVNKALTLQSVNGPQATLIEGYRLPATNNGDGAIRCVYLTNGAALIGFTLTNGGTLTTGDEVRLQYGGGIWCESPLAVISNCVLSGNSSSLMGGGIFSGTVLSSTINENTAMLGGGAAHTALFDSLITSNSANSAGGSFWSRMTDCTLQGNYALGAGGAYAGTLTNCVIRFNQGEDGGGVVGATLVNCIISNNLSLFGSAGGVGDSLLYQCTITDNRAPNGLGGGSVGGALYRCVVSNNFAGFDGGGSCFSDLVQTIVVGNRAWQGGGLYEGRAINSVIVANSAEWLGGGTVSCELINSIVYFNSAAEGDNLSGGFGINSCIIPLPDYSPDCYTNNPGFVDWSAGNFRLQSSSPCVNSGLNSFVTDQVDFVGNPRIVAGTVDIGVYEFQTHSSMLSYAWAQRYGLPTDGSADFLDPDDDGMSNYSEWRSDTVPTNSASALRVVSVTNSPAGAIITWQSVPTRRYWLEQTTNLGVASLFHTVIIYQLGEAGSTTCTDISATNAGPYFYRVGVHQ